MKQTKINGYLMSDIYGQTGVEYVFEPYLKGKNGIKQIDMSVDGGIVSESTSVEATQGSDVVLTIDANLQAITEKALVNTINDIRNGTYGERNKYEATAGAIVVMNVNSGEILSMASYPDYDPNVWIGGIKQDVYDRLKETDALFNRAISGTYAPGSTYKMVPAIAALQTGAVTINEKINDVGIYQRDPTHRCWIYRQSNKTHGYLNISDAIKHSCNYFFYEIGYRIGIDTINKYANSFGLAKKTGIELTGEKEGMIASPALSKSKGEIWTLGFTLSAVIGQGDNNFTPIQIAKYLSILVNGGKQIHPTILKTIINSDGTEVSKEEINNGIDQRLGREKQVEGDIEISDENLAAVLEGMRDVTSESGGTAYSIFKNFNIKLGGKTGSAQTGKSTNAWFAGFAPYDNPEIAIVVVIEDGGSGTLACYAARDIIAQYFGMNEAQVEENTAAIPYTDIQN